jgi:hypothetical protein
VRFSESDITPYLFAGPVFSILNSAKVESGGETEKMKLNQTNTRLILEVELHFV